MEEISSLVLVLYNILTARTEFLGLLVFARYLAVIGIIEILGIGLGLGLCIGIIGIVIEVTVYKFVGRKDQ